MAHYAYKGYLLTYALRLGGLLARRGLLIRATHTILTISFTYGAILDLIPIPLSITYRRYTGEMVDMLLRSSSWEHLAARGVLKTYQGTHSQTYSP